MDGTPDLARQSLGTLARIETELGLRGYQRDGLRAFLANGGRGIAHMATGTGKTRLGVAAILWAREQGEAALVVVPTRALLAQWRAALSSHGLTGNQVRAVSGSSRLRRPTDADVLLTPIQTAMRNPDVLVRMAREGRSLLIVDECHRAGAPRSGAVLVDAFGYRLGLSATPWRPYDPPGTRRVLDYFGGVVHRYDLGTAVADGHLARYAYHVHSVHLDEIERAGYAVLTGEISNILDWVEARFEHLKEADLGEVLAFLRAGALDDVADELQHLLFERARIVKNAVGKLDVFGRLAPSLATRKTIVFAEEIGFAEALGDVARAQGLEPFLYHSLQPTPVRDATLAAFRRARAGVLLAVRALDEGLDIPDAEVAVLAASSTSPRQHIQRRGRVLRPLRDRQKVAEMHDFYVIGVDRVDRVRRIREDAEAIVYHGFEGDADAYFSDHPWDDTPAWAGL